MGEVVVTGSKVVPTGVGKASGSGVGTDEEGTGGAASDDDTGGSAAGGAGDTGVSGLAGSVSPLTADGGSWTDAGLRAFGELGGSTIVEVVGVSVCSGLIRGLLSTAACSCSCTGATTTSAFRGCSDAGGVLRVGSADIAVGVTRGVDGDKERKRGAI
jgi:hypothetical protein